MDLDQIKIAIPDAPLAWRKDLYEACKVDYKTCVSLLPQGSCPFRLTITS